MVLWVWGCMAREGVGKYKIVLKIIKNPKK